MFNIFRKPFIQKYINGYIDGYTDAEKEYFENSEHALAAYNNGYTDGITDNSKILHYKTSQEDLDVAYWQGYNNAMANMYTNEDIKPMSTNDDIWKMSENDDNWYTDGTTYMTDKHIIDRWNELFDANPWLVGMTYDGDCESISCCPYPEPQDWLVFSEITTLMWLANLQDSPVLTKGLIENFGGTQ